MTNDTVLNVWQDGIQVCLITSLTRSEELKVRQFETINGLLRSKGHSNYASITPSVASSISRDLDANVFIQGSINQAGSIIRLNAQLIDSKNDGVLKSFYLDGSAGEILQIIDSLSTMIKNSLIIYEMGEVGLSAYQEKYLKTVNSPEAYRYFIYGQNAFYNNDFPTAIDRFMQALAIDSTLFGAMGKISMAYYNEGNFGPAKEWGLKFYEKKDYLPLEQRIWAEFIYAIFFKTPNERNQYMDQLQEIDDQNPLTYFNKGDGYLEMDQYEKAIPEFEKALEIFHRRKTKPFWVAFYNELGLAYHGAGMYREEKKLYRKAQKDFPDDPQMLDQYAGRALTEGDTVAANRYIEKYISIRKEQSWSEAKIAGSIAYIYYMAKMPDKVEEYYRKALLLEPENPMRINALAYTLIDNERNIDEGIKLLETVLEINPSNYASLGLKGWGLYKQGKYREALDFLQKSWDLRMEHSIYNHAAYVRLEAAKKAVENLRIVSSVSL
jgi:tetratricopeptide (TPR) repeat protein